MYEIYCELRDKKGIKDADVARETGITKSTFTDWKNGRSIPKSDKLSKIAEFLGVTENYLRTGNEKPEILPLMPEQFELLELYSALKDEQKLAIMNLLRSFSV